MWFIHLLALLQKKHYIPDTAIEFILKLLAVFFAVLCRLYPVISPVVDTFPGSLHRMRQLLKVDKGGFVRYVTCPKCDEVYRYDDSVEICGTMRKGKPCNLVVLKYLRSQLLYPTKRGGGV